MRCPHCPAPNGELCRGETVPHFCALVDPSGPIYNPAFIRILVRDDYQAVHRPVPPEVVAKIAKMKSCPFWSRCQTGCGAGHCGLKGGEKVNHQDCFACIERFG
jgi:hypothetical protein